MHFSRVTPSQCPGGGSKSACEQTSVKGVGSVVIRPNVRHLQPHAPSLIVANAFSFKDGSENSVQGLGGDRAATPAYVPGSKPGNWMRDVPRVRVRTDEMRKKAELILVLTVVISVPFQIELAVVNERLSGELQPWEVRNRLEHIRLFNGNWGAIYDHITKSEVTATLAVIEEASRKVEESLSEEARERSSISDLKKELEMLHSKVEVAHEKLHVTQDRVDVNLKRVNRLKAEALALERSSQASTSTSTEATPQRLQGQRKGKKGRGLKSSTEIEGALKNFWYPAEFSSSLKKDMLVPFDLCDEPWVLFRDENGQPSCVKDQCAHRACPLSAGKVENGQVQCPYHGWKFDGEGKCTDMPSTRFCKGVTVTALPCAEKDGFIWIWPGSATPDEHIPDNTRPPPGYEIHAEILVDVPVEHGLLVENLLDLAHAPFTHTSTFARGWPVPEAVKFHANKLLSGNWDPYPIDMAFHPPCVTESLIGLAQPGVIMRGVTADKCEKHLHQVHVCMPSKKGHTRLLYRMSLDFMNWIKYIPHIDLVWKAVAAQDRMERGGDTWANPMPYDKLAVRYRRWRNSTADGDEEEAWCHAKSAKMGAGELFSYDEGDVATCDLVYDQADEDRGC
eukprot:gene16142-22298_t